MKTDTVFVVGAGFSSYAGLPLQSTFTQALLEPRDEEDHPSQLATHQEQPIALKAIPGNRLFRFPTLRGKLSP